MTDDTKPPVPGTPEANDLVVRGTDGDPLPVGTRMIERESYERVIEGLKMTADACMHLAKQEPKDAATWKALGAMFDGLRRKAWALAKLESTLQQETREMRGEPYGWREARDRFLQGLQQAVGGMRQLATCWRGDFMWSVMAQELDRREKGFRDLLYGREAAAPSPLILPPGYLRH